MGEALRTEPARHAIPLGDALLDKHNALRRSSSREGKTPAEPFWIRSLRLRGSAGASPSRIFPSFPSSVNLVL